MINLIAAVGIHGEIGFEGRIPWIDDPKIANILKEDLAWFSKQTARGVLIVGRHTYREMLDMGFQPGERDVVVFKRGDEPVEILDKIEQDFGRDVWVCGGAYTYHRFMPFVQRVYITRIPWTGKADRFMPPIQANWGYLGGPVHGDR